MLLRSTRPIDTAGPIATQKPGRIRCRTASRNTSKRPCIRLSTVRNFVGPRRRVEELACDRSTGATRAGGRRARARAARGGTRARTSPRRVTTRSTPEPRTRAADAIPSSEREHEREHHREDRELERGRDVVGEVGRHRVPGAQRVLEIAVRRGPSRSRSTARAAAGRSRGGAVRPSRAAGLRVRAELHAHRVGRRVALQAEHHEREHEQHADHAERGGCRRSVTRSI